MKSGSRRGFRVAWLLVVVAMSLAFSGTASAAGIKMQPALYDPDGTGCVAAAWVGGEGLPDVGNANHAFYMEKMCDTATNAASFGVVSGVEGLTLETLSFSYRNDGHCGAGAPRFNLYTEDGLIFLGCSSGDHSNAGEGWTKVDFSAQVSGLEIEALHIAFDEGPGFVYLDNITINGTVIGKPGNV